MPFTLPMPVCVPCLPTQCLPVPHVYLITLPPPSHLMPYMLLPLVPLLHGSCLCCCCGWRRPCPRWRALRRFLRAWRGGFLPWSDGALFSISDTPSILSLSSPNLPAWRVLARTRSLCPFCWNKRRAFCSGMAAPTLLIYMSLCVALCIFFAICILCTCLPARARPCRGHVCPQHIFCCACNPGKRFEHAACRDASAH